MIDTILQTSKSDAQLEVLLNEAHEYAQIYLLTKQRHKGCAGTGEFMTLKEEFKDMVDKMIPYCKEKNHLPDSCYNDIDALAVLLLKNKEE